MDGEQVSEAGAGPEKGDKGSADLRKGRQNLMDGFTVRIPGGVRGHTFSPDCPKVREPLCSGWDGELRGKDRHLVKVTTV